MTTDELDFMTDEEIKQAFKSLCDICQTLNDSLMKLAKATLLLDEKVDQVVSDNNLKGNDL